MSHRNDLNELTENAANRETWQDAVSATKPSGSSGSCSTISRSG